MIIGYARVSTTDQDTALQIDALTAVGCERIYQESRSGASKERPELTRCIDAVRSGDTLVVWRLDRLGRSLKDLVQIVSALEENHVGFRSLTETIDTTTAGGKLIFHVFVALAEFERSLIQERRFVVALNFRAPLARRPWRRMLSATVLRLQLRPRSAISLLRRGAPLRALPASNNDRICASRASLRCCEADRLSLRLRQS